MTLFKCLLAMFVTFITFSVQAQVNNVSSGMLDFNAYPYLSDVDSDSVFTINAAASLSGGFSYFSLINFYNEADTSALSETTTFYTEQNIRYQLGKSPFDATLQLNFRSGENNDRHRLGIRWRLNKSQWLSAKMKKIHLAWSMNFHLVQFDHTDAHELQIEHVFLLKAPYLSSRLYLAGFIDHTFGEDLGESLPSAPVVGEIQFGYRLLDNLYIVTEYRINQYRRTDVNNVAVGLQYKMMW